MGGRLFFKVFLAFWLVSCAVLGSWMLTSEYFASRPVQALEERPGAGPRPHRFIPQMIYKLQTTPQASLASTIRATRERDGIDIFLLNEHGEDMLGRAVPEDVAYVADRLQGARRRAYFSAPHGHLIAHDLYRADVGPLRAVFYLPQRGGRILNILGSNPLLRIGLAVLVSGLVCFGLSSLITRRLKALQLASRRLANGDLDTRLQVRERGGDETDELARDFNSMAQQLQERIQQQKRLLGDVSHELRSPLARLRVALALAQKDPGKRDTHLERIELEAERLEQLIGQLLSSQAQAAIMDTQRDLVPLLRQLSEDADFEGREQDKRVLFSTTLASACVLSSGDLLEKSLGNVLRNALTHTAPQSTVRVSLTQNANRYVVTVEDAGPGIPEAELEKVFTAFYRVDTARTRSGGGYGLGLAIARRAIAQHAGDIVAENTGAGLKVTITLPGMNSAGPSGVAPDK